MIDPVLWSLLVAQILMGAFDTIYHHEITERLAWRPAQALELRLHGVRNLIYAAVFLMLGLSEPAGAWALLLIVLLPIEAAITLWDFVEEDRTRELPASERVTHTLLTLNYGVVLALLLPLLWDRIALPTALPLVWYGWLSLFFAAGAAGVVLCGLRDIAAARRATRLLDEPASALALELGAERRMILVTGGTGFVGSRLVEALCAAGHDLIVLTRNPAKARLPAAARAIGSLAAIGNDARIDAIVHLAGESVAGGIWTARRKREIIESRTRITAELRALCKRLSRRPKVLIAASAIGFYGDTGEALVDEREGQGPGFAGESCAATEAAADALAALGVRVVNLRIGLVLARQGGLLARLLLPFEWGMGGPIGGGRQYFSWIHRDDLVRLIGLAIARPDLAGPINAVAPAPVRQREFAKALGQALGRPAFVPLPAFVLRLLPGGMGEELFLSGQRVVPAAAWATGFRFRHPEIGPALEQICGTKRKGGPLPDRPLGDLVPSA